MKVPVGGMNLFKKVVVCSQVYVVYDVIDTFY
jgi:hypothetical protein